jgi:segregation and condensation protein B
MSENDKKKGAGGKKAISSDLSDRLAQAASEWQPDDGSASAENGSHDELQASSERPAPASPTFNPEGGSEYVSFIEEPFGIRTLEISEAQQSSEELDLDKDLDKDFEDAIASDAASDAEKDEDSSVAAAGSDETTEEDAGETSEESDADEEIAELDEDVAPKLASPEESDVHLENLALAIDKQTRELEAQAQAASAETEEQNAAELARQIAEDEQLAAQMAREAAEAEEALETDPELLAALPKEPQPDEQGKLDLSELESCVETLLFMVDKPVSAKKLQEWLGPDFKEGLFEQALQGLKDRYQSPAHGIELVEVSNGWQLRTKPGRAALAKKLSKIQTQRLSTGGMETLAIIAYRQPAMKEEIDKIRGVDSSYFVRGLLDKKLIAITGRSELPGRPMLYSTTDHFLELFGLKDLSALPSLRELEQMVPASQSKNPADEDPRIKEMRRLVDKMKMDTSTQLLYDPKEDEQILTEIRERVKAIPTSTPYLDEQKALEKAAKEAAARGDAPSAAEAAPAGTQLALEPGQADAPELPAGVTAHPEMADLPPSDALDEPEPSTNQV